MSRFYLNDADSSAQPSDLDPDSDLDFDTTTLPFPAPLSRNSFSHSDSFDATTYLSSLSSRHQTLEDLRTELRSLSSTLNNELLDLVNENYADFLGLGTSLRGGEEKVEEVRVGMMGFRRGVEELKERVESRRNEVGNSVEELREVRKRRAVGRALLDIHERIQRLEGVLMLGMSVQQDILQGDPEAAQDDPDWDSDIEGASTDGEDSDGESVNGDQVDTARALKRLRRHIEQYQMLHKLMQLYGPHPFIEAQQRIVEKIRTTLLLDVQNLMRQRPGFMDEKFAAEVRRLGNALDVTKGITMVIRETN